MVGRREITEGARRLRRWFHCSSHRLGALGPGRRGNGHRRDLPAGSLVGVDLTGVGLALVDLRAEDLSEARLVRADLTGADLTGAVLDGARLRRARLSYATLADSRCRKASFAHADLLEADLTGVDARGAGFDHADLRRATLVGADLLGVGFDGCDVRGADFTGAKLAADALADAVVDQATILPSGRAAMVAQPTPVDRLRRGGEAAWGRVPWPVVRPALVGLLWLAGIGGMVVAIETSGGGDLAEELAESVRREPVGGGSATPGRDRPAGLPAITSDRPATDADEDRRPDRAAPGPGTAGTGPAPADGSDDPAGEGDDEPSDPATSDGRAGAGGTGADVAVSGAGATSGDLPADTPTARAADPSPDGLNPVGDDEVAGALVETGDELRELPGPSVGALAAASRVELVVTTEGGRATIRSDSTLGRSDPRTVDGGTSWELSVSSGQVTVQVVPDDEDVTVSCRLLVDGVERSFQSGLAGQTSTCSVDLGPGG